MSHTNILPTKEEITGISSIYTLYMLSTYTLLFILYILSTDTLLFIHSEDKYVASFALHYLKLDKVLWTSQLLMLLQLRLC